MTYKLYLYSSTMSSIYIHICLVFSTLPTLLFRRGVKKVKGYRIHQHICRLWIVYQNFKEKSSYVSSFFFFFALSFTVVGLDVIHWPRACGSLSTLKIHFRIAPLLPEAHPPRLCYLDIEFCRWWTGCVTQFKRWPNQKEVLLSRKWTASEAMVWIEKSNQFPFFTFFQFSLTASFNIPPFFLSSLSLILFEYWWTCWCERR